MKDVTFSIRTNKGFDDAVVSVLKSVEKQGWALFQIYDLKDRLAAKGFNHEKLKIIEICSAKHANNFLMQNKLISLCMPCKINVIEENGEVTIATMKASIIPEMFSGIKSEDAMLVEAEVRKMIEMAA